MNENLNLVEILKDCPKGTKLYSLIYGYVELMKVSLSKYEMYPIRVKLNDNSSESFTEDGRLYAEHSGECVLFPSKKQRDWSKFKPKKSKFDPKTLKPFDKVLARDSEDTRWRCTFYSHSIESVERLSDLYKYVTTTKNYKCCIPYNDDTKHLVGTTEEAPEYYRYWED